MNQEKLSQLPLTYIIPHTHWDREWYVPFQVFRYRMVEMIDKLIDVMEKYPDYKYFNLDCQTVLLEDYLEIRPENKSRLQALIQQKRIGIGPWYLLSSPWLQSGEGIVRNLLKGNQICDDFQTSPVNLGWVPDQYIHPIQFPQIYQGFNIDFMAFSRGMGNQYEEVPGLTCEFHWKGLDDSSIIAFHLKSGYGHYGRLDTDIFQALNQIVIAQGGILKTPWATNLRLNFSGSDHSYPDERLIELIDMYNDDEDIIEELGSIKLSSWDEFLHDFMEKKPILKTVTGEISGRKYQMALHGVFSSYMPLKQKSFYIHDLLERWSEPFSCYSSLFGLKKQKSFIDLAWKWLLRNQPHDSSWTSSVDQVQKEMETRYAWAEQIGTDVYRRSLQWFVQHVNLKNHPNQIPVFIFNPHPWNRSGIITLRFLSPFKTSEFLLTDKTGNEIPAFFTPKPVDEIDRVRRRVFVQSAGILGSNFYEMSFHATDIPSLGFTTFYISNKLASQNLIQNETQENYIENQFVKLTVDELGQITLKNKQDGSIYNNIFHFEDTSDEGDGWEYKPFKDEIPIRTHGKLIQCIKTELCGARQVLSITRIINIPETADLKNSHRSSLLLEIPITTEISIVKDSRVVEFHSTFTNIAQSHRLRAIFPTTLYAKNIWVNGHFGMFERSIALPSSEGWTRPAEGLYPHHKFIHLWDASQKKGFTLYTRGTPSYEAFYSDDNPKHVSLAMTLVRSTGRWGAHINELCVFTPAAQLLGQEINIDFAISLDIQSWKDSSLSEISNETPIYRLAEEFYTPLRWEEYYDAFIYRIPQLEKNLPDELGFFNISQPHIMLSILKHKEENHKLTNNQFLKEEDAYVLRVYNIKHEESPVDITFHRKLTEIQMCNLNEEILNETSKNFIPVELNPDRTCLKFMLGASKIATFILRFR